MAVLCNDPANYLSRTTALVASSSDYTAMAWVKFNALPAVLSYFTPWTRGNTAMTAVTGIYTDLDGGNGFGLAVNNGGGPNLVDGGGFTIGQWLHFAYVKTSNSHRLYINGTNKGAVTVDISAVSITKMFMGGDDTGASLDSNVTVAYFREWSDNLTAGEIVDEMNSTVPLEQLVDLETDTPLANDLLDDSGNGNTWTEVGATSFVTQPTFIANSTAATATAMSSLPYSASLDLNPGTIAFDAWYSYTGGASASVISVWGYGNLTGNTPEVVVYAADGTTQFLAIENDNAPVQVPISAATTYLFRFRPNSRTTDPFTLTVTAEAAPTQLVPIGSIAVNDDTPGFPLALMSSVNGDDYNVLRFVNDIPAGEGADILDNGIVVIAEEDTTNVRVYDSSDWSLVATTDFTQEIVFAVRTCRTTQRVWLAAEVPAGDVITRYITDAGVLGTLHTMTGITQVDGIAANNAETILYHAHGSGSAIKQWNLSTDTAGANLVAGIAGYTPLDILVLSDDSILVCYSNTGTSDVYVKRYSAAGATLNTYNFGTDNQFPGGTFPRLAYSLLDPASFWIWRHPTSTPFVSRFSEIDTSTGASLRTVVQQEYETGAYLATANASPVMFGPSFSCPFWVATVAFPAGGASIIVEKVTVPSSDSTSFDFTATGLTPASFSLAHGQTQLYNPVTPASGYGIAETENDLFITTIVVDNGSPSDNITVGVDETVTVTVTNTRADQFTVSTETYPIRRLRRSPHVSPNMRRAFHAMFQVDMETGVGLSTGQGSEPLVMFRFSRDGGRTWGDERFVSAGRMGEYLARVMFWRQGQARDAVYEIAVSDPVPWRIVGAYIDLEEGES